MPKTTKVNLIKLHKQFSVFFNALLHNDENQALAILQKFSLKHDPERVKVLCESYVIPYEVIDDLNQSQHIFCNSIMFAVYYNYKRLVRKLIDLGVNPNGIQRCPDNATLHNKTTLMVVTECAATPEPDIEMLDILLSTFNINLLAVDTPYKQSVLLKTMHNSQAFRMILQAAINKNIVLELLALKNNESIAIFELLAFDSKIDLLKDLMSIPDYITIINANVVLHDLRYMAWKHPELREQIEPLCIPLREKIAANGGKKPATVIKACTAEQQYKFLYGSPLVSDNPTVAASKLIFAQFSSMLNSVEPCLSLLQELNSGFAQFVLEKTGQPFPVLDAKAYQFAAISEVFYPLPVSEHYVGLKKHSLLSKYLISLFNQHGFGWKTSKAIGYLPEHIFNMCIQEGNFLAEDKLGLGLFHGKLSHMLQLAILFLAIKNGKLSLTQMINQQAVTVTLSDLLHGLVTIPIRHPSEITFTRLLDNYLTGEINFGTPHLLSAFMMQAGHRLGLSTLADYLIDSFCQGLIRYLHCYNTISHQQITLAEFVIQLQDFNLAFFQELKPFQDWSVERARQKQLHVHQSVDENGGMYALVGKKYDLGLFKPAEVAMRLPIPAFTVNKP